MKSAVALAVASAIILVLALWMVWPSAPADQHESPLRFFYRSAPLPDVIDPPLGFHWGDSTAHVEALLGYSSAEIVMRAATGRAETWTVEGLIQPGLKNARFIFENNGLTAVELQCQYDSWNAQRYRAHMEELRGFFDGRYGTKRHAENLEPPGQQSDRLQRFGYSWRLGESGVMVFCRSDFAPVKHLSVTDLIIRYWTGPNPDSQVESADRWNDTPVSPVIGRKLQPSGENPPAGSNLGITGAKLLNTSTAAETALSLQLDVRLQSDAVLDPTKVTVEVNFYDALANGEIVLTDSQVNLDWRSRRDWKQSNPESLSVSYIRKPEASPDENSPRKFFGYVATVYYGGRLECVRAEPITLINLFPVRTFISPFEIAHSAADRRDFTTAANLYRQAADQGNLFALENLAWFYAHGKGVEKNYRQACIFYERAALQNTPRALNALAWFLATCEDNSIRNGTEAVRHATEACELTYWQEWKYIDTLAAAWAEKGDFKRAIEYEQQALALKGLDEASRQKSEDRLALYRKRHPVRE